MPRASGRRTWTSSAPAIDPIARAGQARARCWRSFRPASRTTGSLARISRFCWSSFATTGLRWSCGTAAGATACARRRSCWAQYGAAWAQIDEPKFRLSIRQNLMPNVRTFYYLRLHGRNAAQWWRHDKSEDRYNYLYSPDELEPFAAAAEAASKKVEKAYLYANNHFSAKSVANAAILKHDLGQDLPGEYPPAFVERYPDLKGIVKILKTYSRRYAFLSRSATWIDRRSRCPRSLCRTRYTGRRVRGGRSAGCRTGCRRSARRCPDRRIATAPRTLRRFFVISATPIGLPLAERAPPVPLRDVARSADRRTESGSPARTRWKRWPS